MMTERELQEKIAGRTGTKQFVFDAMQRAKKLIDLYDPQAHTSPRSHSSYLEQVNDYEYFLSQYRQIQDEIDEYKHQLEQLKHNSQ